MFVEMKAFFAKYYQGLLFVIINIFIKTLFLDSEPICQDEPFSIYHAQFTIAELINHLKNYNNPPLFEFILHFWIKLFGISAFSVRVLPMIFSSLSVFLVYKIGKDFFDNKIAVVASALFTFSTMQILYAHDCRVYSLFLLLTLTSFYQFFKILKFRDRSTKHWMFLSISNILIMYAHYFGAFVWIVEGIIIALFFYKNKRILIKFCLMILLCIVAYIPQIPVAYFRFFGSVKNGTWLKPPEGIESVYNMIWSFTNMPVPAVMSLAILIFAMLKFLFFSDKKITNQYTKYTVIWFLFPFLFMFFISYKVPMFLDRYLIFLTPAYYFMLGIALTFLFYRKSVFIGISIVLIIVFVFSVSLNPSKKSEINKAVEYIKTQKNDSTVVLICPSDFSTNFVYYYDRNSFMKTDTLGEYNAMNKSMINDNIYFINHIDSSFFNRIHDFKKVIYLDAGADFLIPDNFVKRDLSVRYKLQKDKIFFENFFVYVYSNY